MPTQKYEMDLRNIAYKKFEKEPKLLIKETTETSSFASFSDIYLKFDDKGN
jgi:hypothetical protein